AVKERGILSASMRTVLITGANKGIGFALAKAVLSYAKDTAVLLGSRSEARGEAAVQALVAADPEWSTRLRLVVIDVASKTSVDAAAGQVRGPLYAIVNNAGIMGADLAFESVLNVNARGPERVCDAFLPMVDDTGGRVVNISSASGPNFVAQCSAARQAGFTNRETSLADYHALLDQGLELQRTGGLRAAGFGQGQSYGFSKACLNLFTMIVARQRPELYVNACTPGFIATDLTRPIAEAQGASPADMGMKPPEKGTVAPMHLLFGEVRGSGWYFGSDAQRSPLDRYRAPGDPPYEGP
ncbi:MAG: SDR family NAD(P)-dependent oxidoreductase, partial [Myxococcota bacterium]